MIKMANTPSAEIFNGASAPEFATQQDKYIITAGNKHYSAGMYTITYDAVNDADKLIKISVPYHLQGEKASARVMVSFLDSEGKLIQSDYFTKTDNEFTLKKEIPEETEKIKLEMLLYCFGKGKVTYCAPKLEVVEKEPHRIVKVASAFIERKGTYKDNFQNKYTPPVLLLYRFHLDQLQSLLKR